MSTIVWVLVLQMNGALCANVNATVTFKTEQECVTALATTDSRHLSARCEPKAVKPK